MKVTDYYPVIYAEDIDAETKRFTEDLGFTVIHKPQLELLDYVALENDKKRRVDIVRSHFPADDFKDGFLGMRVNVDDFDGGISYFAEQGYTLFGEAHETESSITALLKKDDGSCLIMFYHKKKD